MEECVAFTAARTSIRALAGAAADNGLAPGIGRRAPGCAKRQSRNIAEFQGTVFPRGIGHGRGGETESANILRVARVSSGTRALRLFFAFVDQ
jgi:hypothetical protein